MKISFLLHNVYGIGGTIRSTVNLAGALATRHDVEIVSVFRTQDKPSLTVSGKVRITSLIDKRKGAPTYDGGHELMGSPSQVFPPTEEFADRYTRLADERVAGFLRGTDAEVVIATRPGLVVYLAEFGERRYLRIGQEHETYHTHNAELRAAQDAAIARLDAFVAVSEADATIHRARLPGVRTRLVCIPNGVPLPKVEPSDGSTKLVVAAGRLVEVKRYDLLIQAFATVAAERPDWQLRLYGRGPERQSLRALIDDLGLNDHVFLMGPYSPIETEWAKGSIAAVSSDQESFGMTIVEAMHCGLPVVATDCPHGPSEIITDGVDGLLVPVGDPGAIAAGLLKLINDDEQRRTMAGAARQAAARYRPPRIATRYEQLIGELLLARRSALDVLRARVRRAAGTALQPLRARRRAPGPGQAAAPEPKPAPTREPRPLRPQAGCTVDTDGNVVVTLRRRGLTGSPLRLTLSHRGGEAEPIHLPLPSLESTTGHVPVVLERARHTLAEGRWDLHVERPHDGQRRRVAAGLVEQRGLLALDRPASEPVTSWVPYVTQDGHLALRTWHRRAHAEVDAVHCGPEEITVRATLLGAGFGATDPAVSARSRIDGEPALTLPAERHGERGFVFRLPYPLIAGARGSHQDVWDLYVEYRPGEEPAPLGRILGDLVERKKIDAYPATRLDSPRRGPTRVRPFFTVTNDLAVSATGIAADTVTP